MPFAKNIGKSIGKNLSDNCSPKLLDHVNKSPTDTHKHKTTCKKSNLKTVEATDDLIGNKIPNTITEVSGTSSHNSLETVTNEREW